MRNELIKRKKWFQRNGKLLLSLVVIVVLIFTVFISLTFGHLGDLGKAYAEPQLYNGALKLAQQNMEVIDLLGQLESIGKIAILEGNVEYNNENSQVDLSVIVVGSKGKATMQVIANRINKAWEYKKITIRIKNPREKRGIIIVK